MTTQVWRPPITVRFEDGNHRYELIPLTSNHRGLLVDGFSKLSERSRYQRFMAPVNELSQSEIDYLTDLDMVHRFAWGVLVDDEPAGVGRYAQTTTSPQAVEVAVTVVDEFQGRGIGRILLGALAVVAESSGYSRLEFEVLADNRPMLGLLESIEADLHPDGAIVHAEADPSKVPLPSPLTPDSLLAAVGAARSTLSAR